MTNLDPLIRDFLEWISNEPRPYREVMDVWKTSCPRLTVWEDSVDRGFISRLAGNERGVLIEITSEGRDFLLQRHIKVPVEMGAVH
jgi:hypothetical protein